MKARECERGTEGERELINLFCLLIRNEALVIKSTVFAAVDEFLAVITVWNQGERIRILSRADLGLV